MKISAWLVSAALAVGLVAVPGVAQAAPLAPAQGVPCSVNPWASAGCQGYLGAKVRRDLMQRGLFVMLSDEQLGRAVTDICFSGRVSEQAAVAWAPSIRLVRRPYCG